MDTFMVRPTGYGGCRIRMVANSASEIKDICKKYGYDADIQFDGETKTVSDLKDILTEDIKKRKQEAEKSLNAIIDLESELECEAL